MLRVDRQLGLGVRTMIEQDGNRTRLGHDRTGKRQDGDRTRQGTTTQG